MWWLEVGSPPSGHVAGGEDCRLRPELKSSIKVAGSSTAATSLSRVGAAIGTQVQPMGRQWVCHGVEIP